MDLRRVPGEQDVSGCLRLTPCRLCTPLQLDPIVRVPQNRDEQYNNPDGGDQESMEQKRTPEVEEIVVSSEHLKHTRRGGSRRCGHVSSGQEHLFVKVAEDCVEERLAGVQNSVEAGSVVLEKLVVKLDDQCAGDADHEQDDQEQQRRRVDR